MLSFRTTHFTLLIVSWCFFHTANGFALSQFAIHKGFSQKLLDKYKYTNDFDDDKKPDWGSHQGIANYLVPLDNDLDNDGIENLMDAMPYTPNLFKKSRKNHLPSHLLHNKSRSIRYLQRKIFKISGVVVLIEDEMSDPTALEAILKIFKSFTTYQSLAITKHLKSIYISNTQFQSEALGYFVDPLKAIILKGSIASYSNDQIISTIAHEMGHAFTFGNVSPKELASLSTRYGGWPETYPQNLYDEQLTQKFWGNNKYPEMFPSSYAFVNIHEWFAENFAHFVMKRMNLLDEKRNSLDFWLETKMRRAKRSPQIYSSKID